MNPVSCYGCGRQYLPTEEATNRHTHHTQSTMSRGVIRWEQLAGMLEECQRERDEVLRRISADPHVLVAPLP